MRLFLDTNVWVAAIAARGLCEALLEECLAHHEILTTALVWEELESVLARKLSASAKTRAEVAALWQSARTVADAAPDRGDNDARLIEAAAAAGAEAFVTGDRALQEQVRHGAMAIVSPRQMFERLVRGA